MLELNVSSDGRMAEANSADDHGLDDGFHFLSFLSRGSGKRIANASAVAID